MSYQNTAYSAGNYQIEAAKNPKTEQIRAIEPLETLISYQTNAIAADGLKVWMSLASDVILKSLWISFAASPSGTITLFLDDESGTNYLALIIPVASGETLGLAWGYDFKFLSVRKGDRIRIQPSAAINKAFLVAEPCLLADAIQGG
jgi:hypothetical protein